MNPIDKRDAEAMDPVSRRCFLLASGGAALGATLVSAAAGAAETAPRRTPAPTGPGARYVPRLAVAFVRRKGEYGMRWPGEIYDGQAALQKYQTQIEQTGKALGMQVTFRQGGPIYSLPEADQWAAQAASDKPDGLLVVLLDRQEHSWPTARKAMDTGLPTVVFAPVGAAFTTNTTPVAAQAGALICSTDDFRQAAFAMKMIRAAARLREMRFVVIKGTQRRDERIRHFGTNLRYVPAASFLEEYNRTPVNDEVKAIAAEYLKGAVKIAGTTEQDVINGVKSYVVARSFLQREDADGISMDCLGALGKTKVSLPCISWSRMLDDGIPAACEADREAMVTHALVQNLFDRPGFQQDPVPETAREALIGAHCTCPTRLNGFSQPPEPYRLSPHHGKRDAVPVPVWKIGQRITVVDVLLSADDKELPKMVISAGSVTENISVPPAGGCVVSVMVRLDGITDLLAYPGFHQLFLYGDFKKELRDYCRLFRIQPLVV